MTGATPYDAIVVGGGLHGLSAALHLARAGMKPIVLEKDYPGRHASGVNAGGVRRLGRDLFEVPLAVASLKIWQNIESLVDDSCGFTPCGQVRVAEAQADLAKITQRVREVQAIGFEHEELIGQDELRDLVPALAPHCLGAILCRGDGAADPFRTVTAFRRKAEALGATIQPGAEVHCLTHDGGIWRAQTAVGAFEAPNLINTAGAWGGKIAAWLGEAVPLEVVGPTLMITERVAAFLTPVLGAANRKLSIKQFANGTILIGGGHRSRAIPQTNRTEISLAGPCAGASTVCELFPSLQDLQVVRIWAGIEGVMPDGIPVIGASAEAANAWHAFGFSAHGFQLGPIVGRIIADLVVTGATDLPIEPFRITRFARLPGPGGAGE